MHEKEPYTREDYFTASDDIADSLKTEYSSISPEEQSFVNETGVAIKNYIVQKYGEHISEKMKERLETAERRILLVSPEDYKTLAEEWVPGSKAEVKDVSGHYTRLGSMVVINDMVENSKDIWNKNKEIFDKFPGGQQSLVLPYIRLSLITETLVHELVHSCEEDAGNEKIKDAIKRQALDEAGASFITGNIMKERYSMALPTTAKFQDERVAMFGNLLSKYGEDVYDIFFSNIPDSTVEKIRYENLVKKIYSEFTSEKLVGLGIIRSYQAVIYDNMRE
ncbi:MAG: hypothetical protein UV35_C0034G0006 [candidate division WWE3 bacterium GW2011_GWB1_42_6]|uniref:Uncharacterized protein n=1 Tax=candidate division WWE3 bacterium GW2011_GWB1_42_6 TaxID=1619115 RepID=A0A0G1AX68_UNCKA|nr:MAG: hypothetical protein UV35_C0034G0006 [candidate division WWE3 bacterium GW2011_GWB1_42_6]